MHLCQSVNTQRYKTYFNNLCIVLFLVKSRYIVYLIITN